jgi:hypothetical protein
MLMMYRLIVSVLFAAVFVHNTLGADKAQNAVEQRKPCKFYLDSKNGNDNSDGLSPQTAWETISRLNRQPLIGGDTVLFKRGGLWREPLLPKSGSEGNPVIYDSFGQGEKPILQGAVSRNNPADWKSCGKNLWETVKIEPVVGNKITVADSPWSVYQEKPADVSLKSEKKDGANRSILTVKKAGEKTSRIQFIGPKIPAEFLNEHTLLTFRARATKPLTIPGIVVRHQGFPYSSFHSASNAVNITGEWKEYSVFLPQNFTQKDAAEAGQLVLYLGGNIPDDLVFEFEFVSIHSASYPQGQQPITLDAGNIIFDGGKLVGFKRWGIDELKESGDFWYDSVNHKVVLYSEVNPAASFSEIELCLKRNIISHAGLNDCIIRNLVLRYSAGHGVGGQGAYRTTIEDCDIYFIGGGHLYTRDNKPVRYGNGIEWWSEASDCLVQRCRLWEIYDVAFTVQGNIPNKTVRNIVMRDNLIWNCEQSFEYWRREEGTENTAGGQTLTENVIFENNTCVDSGFGWSHRQRPDKRGTHFLSYQVTTKTDITLRNNIFCNGKNSCISMYSDWRKGATLYNNLWYQPAGEWFVEFQHKYLYKTEEYNKYLTEFGIDKNSILAKPVFIDAAKRDYRLAAGSPGLTTASDGGVVGIRNPQTDR